MACVARMALDVLCAARCASAGAVLIQRMASRRAIDFIANLADSELSWLKSLRTGFCRCITEEGDPTQAMAQ